MENKTKRCELHFLMKYLLFLYRCMGLFPVEGLLNKTTNNLKFNIKSLYGFIYGSSMLLSSLVACHHFHRASFTGLNYRSLIKIVYSLEVPIRLYVLLIFAKSWPGLIKRTENFESTLPKPGRNTIRYRIGFASLTVLLLILETTFFYIYEDHRQSCLNTNNTKSNAESYFENNDFNIFKYVQFLNTFWSGVALHIPPTQCFLLQFLFDIIVTYISVYLNEYFNSFNKRIITSTNKVELPWHELRLQYTKMVSLVKLVDSRISTMVLISLSSNLIFICSTAFLFLRQDYVFRGIPKCISEDYEYNINTVKILYSIYLTMRLLSMTTKSLMVTLTASRLYQTTLIPANYIYEIPEKSRCKEINRLLIQINTSKVALSGLGFFYVNRETIFTMISSIITYELVLVQFERQN